MRQSLSEVKMGRGSPVGERVCKNIVEYFKNEGFMHILCIKLYKILSLNICYVIYVLLWIKYCLVIWKCF